MTTNTVKHTPGPWQGCLHLRGHADETCGCGYRGGIWSTTADVMICEMGAPNDSEYDEMIPRSDRATQIADHWLIAAAPDLLACLIETLEIAIRNEDGEFADRARAAISKATGSPAPQEKGRAG